MPAATRAAPSRVLLRLARPRREALEAEAQKVAQLAVNAEGAVSKARRQLDDAQADLETAQATQAKAAVAVEGLQQLMAAKVAEAAQGELGHGKKAGAAGLACSCCQTKRELARLDPH